MADEVLTYGLNVEVGMRLEVLNENNEVMFQARVDEVDGDSMKISNASGSDMPVVMFNSEFKLRGHHDGRTVVYHGVVCGSTARMWKLDQLTNWSTWERREFFRQNIAVEALVKLVESAEKGPVKEEAVKCKLLDVSGGGVLLGCDATFAWGDELLVGHAEIIPNAPPFAFRCTVRRTQQTRYTNLYGCQFLELSPAEQDRLIRAIFMLQREEAKRLRGR